MAYGNGGVHDCIEFLKHKITALEKENANLQKTNDQLIVRNTFLENDNVRLLAAFSVKQKKRRVTCGLVLSKGEKFYRCYTCELRRLSVICWDCFNHGQHSNHRYVMMEAETDTAFYCDCGDTRTLRPEASCCEHSLTNKFVENCGN